MMRYLLIGALATISFATPSLAEKLTLTFSGTLDSGTDTTGVFGANTDLTGESVSVQFFIDTTLGARTEANNQLQYIGGFFFRVKTSPVTSGAQVSQSSENQTGPVLHFDTISAFSDSSSDAHRPRRGANDRADLALGAGLSPVYFPSMELWRFPIGQKGRGERA